MVILIVCPDLLIFLMSLRVKLGQLTFFYVFPQKKEKTLLHYI